jgi:hypothetical protein
MTPEIFVVKHRKSKYYFRSLQDRCKCKINKIKSVIIIQISQRSSPTQARSQDM